MVSFEGRVLAIPAVLSLICFLSYSSQYLFTNLAPRPLTTKQSIYFNISLIALLISYARAILTDPGRVPNTLVDASKDQNLLGQGESNVLARERWCRVCQQHKPPRSHHCRVCKRCIPKMDHHCPWTYNCVSDRTFPHFFRFVFFAVTSMMILEYHLFIRSVHIWNNRHASMFNGPTVYQLCHLFLLDVVNSIVLLALSILLLRSSWSLMWNITTIEDWEIDRHETLLRRARTTGGYLDGPDGLQVRIKRQEFPFDIGIWANIAQGMGTFLAWLWPFASSPSKTAGFHFETNGLEDSAIGWPPPDPDRIPRIGRKFELEEDSTNDITVRNATDVEAFRKRQQQDYARWNKNDSDRLRRRQPFHKRYDDQAIAQNDTSSPDLYTEEVDEGEESWRDHEGQRLKDFGLDEEAEFYDQDDDVPLAELVRNRRSA